MNGLTAADLSKLGIGTELKELKFGKSFSGTGGKAFHTIRYDFKPASVDTTKMATLDVNNSQVTISMPHSDGTGSNTVFAGPRKPYGKECVLIIDPETGECVLEKLTHSIQVKKTRQEKPEGSRKSNGLPPVLPSEMKKHPHGLPGSNSSNNSLHRSGPDLMSKASSSSSYDKKSSNNSSNSSSKPLNTSSLSMQRRPQSPMLNALPRNSPHNNTSPGRGSPPNGHSSNSSNAFDALLSNHSKQSKLQQQQQQQQQLHQPPPQPPQQTSTMPSLTNFDDLLLAGSPVNTTSLSTSSSSSSSSSSFRSGFKPSNNSSNLPASATTNKNSHHSQPTGASAVTTELSESSSDSSSSISSSDDDDSSDEDMEVVPEPDPDNIILPNILGQSHMDKSPSTLSVPMIPSYTTSHNPPPKTSIPPASSSSLSINRSMPSHLLSEDLQLSESCSDSD